MMRSMRVHLGQSASKTEIELNSETTFHRVNARSSEVEASRDIPFYNSAHTFSQRKRDHGERVTGSWVVSVYTSKTQVGFQVVSD